MTLFLVGLFLSIVSVAILAMIHRGRSPWEYMPVLLECSLPFVFLMLAALPIAFPWLFQHVLGHSIYALYNLPHQGNVTVTGTWFSERWLELLRALAAVLIGVGIVWAGLNLLRRSAVVSNMLALSLGVVWLLAQLMGHLFLAPFD